MDSKIKIIETSSDSYKEAEVFPTLVGSANRISKFTPYLFDEGKCTIFNNVHQTANYSETDVCPTLLTDMAKGMGPLIMDGKERKDPKEETPELRNPAIRRITPIEAERLQGFPDDWTKVPFRGKPADQCPESPRYIAIGNSWAVPVIRWLGKRIQKELGKKNS